MPCIIIGNYISVVLFQYSGSHVDKNTKPQNSTVHTVSNIIIVRLMAASEYRFFCYCYNKSFLTSCSVHSGKNFIASPAIRVPVLVSTIVGCTPWAAKYELLYFFASKYAQIDFM